MWMIGEEGRVECIFFSFGFGWVWVDAEGESKESDWS